MAVKKLKYLTKEDRQLILDLEGSWPNTIKYVEETGTLPKDVVDYYNSTETGKTALAKLQSVVGRLGTKEMFDRFIKDTADEANLTKQELYDRLEAYKGLGDVSVGAKVLDKNALEATIHSGLKQIEGDQNASKLTPIFVKEYLQGKILSKDEIRNLTTGVLTSGEGRSQQVRSAKNETIDYLESVSRKISQGQFIKSLEKPTFDTDIKRVQGLISSIEAKEQKESAISDLLAGGPEEARLARERFIKGEVSRGADYIGEVAAPFIARSLNVKNPMLTKGGQVAGLIGQESVLLARKIQELASKLEKEDFEFFSSATYENTIRKLIESSTNIQQQVQFEQTKERTGREVKFQTEQSNLMREAQLDLFRRQQESLLQTQKSRLTSQQQKQQEMEEQQLLMGGAQALGQVGTMALLT